MYERFTDQARKVMLLANQEAHCEYIGTVHLLLGLIDQYGSKRNGDLRNQRPLRAVCSG